MLLLFCLSFSIDSSFCRVDASNTYTWTKKKPLPLWLMQPPRNAPSVMSLELAKALDAGPDLALLAEARPASRQLARGARSWMATTAKGFTINEAGWIGSAIQTHDSQLGYDAGLQPISPFLLIMAFDCYAES